MSKYFIPCTLNILSVNLLSLDLPSEIFMSFVGSKLIFCSKIGSKYGQPPFSDRKKNLRGANPRRSENSLFMRFISDYSMIEATLPEPTVLPPSRYLDSISPHILCTFSRGINHIICILTGCIFIILISWHRFGTSNICFILFQMRFRLYFSK